MIPARYGSTRFPGKPLADLAGKPMIWHTYHNAKTSAVLTKLVVATDDERIQKVVEEFGGEVVMTDVNLENGTERCHAVLTQLQSKGDGMTWSSTYRETSLSSREATWMRWHVSCCKAMR